MAYDEDLAARVREVLAPTPATTEKRMFGGLAFLVDGRMAVAVSGSGGLMVRVDPARAEDLLGPHVARMEMRGRAMKGWLLVQPPAYAGDDDLQRWVGHGVAAAAEA